MPSPLLQNQRHIELLKRATAALDMPTRLGLRMPLRFESLILVSPSARIIRPKNFDTSRVIKADHLRERVLKDIDSESLLKTVAGAAKLVSSETVQDVARQLAKLHRPLREPVLAETRTPGPPATPAPAVTAPLTAALVSGTPPPTCKKCSGEIGQILHGQYGYYFKCRACAGNTAVRLACEPGHKPRIRKQGQQFLRECSECGTSQLYFQNP
jgi:hypothetical protein